ncbi:disease resistance protein [Gossypium australe]|uniref:Disease resistance protein n=1 Tax=Gossypium australe TaxID=47621 RepID=A0A5B6WJL2_9ROSI|nr:disease resistance protein [Gossypium australe]
MHRDIERRRRQELATLYASLRNLLPPKYIRGKRSISDQVDGAFSYIKYLKKRIDGLSGKRDELKKGMSMSCIEAFPSSVVVRQSLDGVEIVISDSVGAQALTLSKVLQQLLEEGLDVVNCVSSRTDGALIHTIKYEHHNS